MDPATIRYSNESHAPRETVAGRKLRNSPSAAAVRASNTPPASICAPELMTLDGGSGSLRVSADDTDQLIDAMISATAPALSIGVPPRFKEWLISTATPPIPIKSANANREKCGSPHKIDNRESQQSLPPRAMGFGFHSGFLPALYQFPCPVAHTSRTTAHSETILTDRAAQLLDPAGRV